ncbi:hypothetical protein [Parabacteroides merdae]|jgi:hypothetical protein|uniref:hypothetical protein n=1 Tax=Parabacteroides merdae TaxID=46503 RepID=UPI0034A1E985
MAKKLTMAEEDSIRMERTYNRERNRVINDEQYSKRKVRRRFIDGLADMVTGRPERGQKTMRDAIRQRSKESARNGIRHAANEAIYTAEQKIYGGKMQQNPQNPVYEQQHRTDRVARGERNETLQNENGRDIPVIREGANGITLNEMKKLNELKKNNPEQYNREVLRMQQMKQDSTVLKEEPKRISILKVGN